MVWPVSLVLFLVASVKESGNATSYVKRFEKNGSVCSYVESILKKDQPGREPWELDSRDLGGIIWEKKGAIDSGLEIAGFDLNNDGNRELLVKQSNWGVHGYRRVQFLEVRKSADASSFSADDLQNQENILATSGDPRGAKTLSIISQNFPRLFRRYQE